MSASVHFTAAVVEIAETPPQTGECATCGEIIRSTPYLTADGWVRRSITGWEHVLSARVCCDAGSHLLGMARPA